MIAERTSSAQELLTSLEVSAAKVGLLLNAKKTECLLLNEDSDHSTIRSIDGSDIKETEEFKYLGSYVVSSKKDFLTRKGQAWSACNKLHLIWQSDISRATKINLFKACVESILLYGAETWTMNKEFRDRLDGTYTRLLMRVQNLSWRNHPTKAQIYGCIPPISVVVAQRRLRFAGHCHRAKDQVISDILLWRLPCPSRGTRPLTFPDVLSRDTGLTVNELGVAMSNRDQCKQLVAQISRALK